MKKKTNQSKKTTFKKGSQITSGNLTAIEAKQKKANTDPVRAPHLADKGNNPLFIPTEKEVKQAHIRYKIHTHDDIIALMALRDRDIIALKKSNEITKEAFKKTIEDLGKELEEKNKYIVKLSDDAREREKYIGEQTQKHVDFRTKVGNKDAIILEKKERILHLQSELEEKSAIIKGNEDEMSGRNLLIFKLLAILETVQSILHGLNWLYKLFSGKSITKVLKQIDSILKKQE